MKAAPVLLLAFNRPEKLKLCLESLVSSGVNNLYIAIDGPRKDTLDKAKIENCLEIIQQFEQKFDQIITQISNENKGCRRAIQDSIDWFFTQVEFGLIVEDDILVSADFVKFATWCGREYESNNEIWVVNGWVPFRRGEATDVPWLGRIPTVWGWATWRDRWALYDRDIANSGSVNPSSLNTNRDLISKESFNRYWSHAFSLIRNGWDTWDYQLVYSLWKNGGFVINPPFRLTQNIGFDQDATHTFRADRRSNEEFDLQGFNSKLFGCLKFDPKLIYQSEELQFGYSVNQRKKLWFLIDNFVVKLSDIFENSEFQSAKLPLKVKLRFFARDFYITLKSVRRIRSIIFFKRFSYKISRFVNWLYWGIKSRVKKNLK